MRFHITSLPHTETIKDYCWCAYTEKVRKFCNMMTDMGHDVFLYAGTRNEARVKEHIEVVTEEDREKWFSHYDWNTMVFSDWDKDRDSWYVMNQRSIRAIKERKQPGDILGIIAGYCQQDLQLGLPDMRCVEWGVGYEGILPNTFHVFESYAWMHYLYGKYDIRDGRFFDTVVPNSFDPDDYIFSHKKEDYLLFLGRLTERKGLEVLRELHKRGHKIITAGQGQPLDGIEHRGVVRGKEKAELLSKAKAVLVPTFYIEPFGGVAVEAMLSGTPAITTDFGAFTETVPHHLRCHTIKEFEQAIERAKPTSQEPVYKYTTLSVQHDYSDYFKRLSSLDNKGWYS